MELQLDFGENSNEKVIEKIQAEKQPVFFYQKS